MNEDEIKIIKDIALKIVNLNLQLLVMVSEENNHSLERTDIKRSEPPLEQGENPCVKVTKEIDKEILNDYAKSVLNESKEKI
jgi:hypothetical protein